MKKKILLLITFFFTFVLGYGQTETIITTGTGTFIVPCDVTSIIVEAWGAGGAGGGSISKNSKGGGGGAGGSYVSSVLSVIPGQIINYNVGSGPIGIYGDGAIGEGSWFLNNTTVFAQGGAGGSAPSGGTVSGGTGSISSSIGNVKIAGANGSNGTATVGGKGGNGGNSGGNGGAAITSEANGNPGSQPGGAGGGALIPDKSDHSGGNGGNGQINITYTSSLKTYCTPSFTWGISPITNVTFAGINNTTSNSTSSSNIESFCISGSVVQGSFTNSISTKGNTVGNYIQNVYAFIDWDQNGVLGNNSNEIYNLGTILNSTGVDAIVVSSNIAVPIAALLGTTKMRIIQRDVNTDNPCYSSNDYGQVEDYQITVTAPVPTITSFSPDAGCVGTTITINGTNFTGATAANVKIGGTAVSSITSISATQIVAIIGSGTTGKVTATNSGGTATSVSSFTVYNLLSNNSLSYTNGTSGQMSVTPAEGTNGLLTASSGSYFSNVAFASYGNPNGTFPNFTLGSCHATTSQSVTEGYLLGNNSTTIPATNSVFGDPCSGTVKRLYVLASYVEPICNGGTVTITGSAPVGGDSTYTYLWESSTASASTGFTSATGTNNNINYTSGSITQTTWFRRTVYSCTINNTSSVTMVKVDPVIANNAITASQAICSGTSPSGLVGSTPTGGNSVYTYLWESSTTSATTGFTIATGTNSTINYSPGALATNTYFRRKVTSGSCANYSTAISITINPTTSINSQSTTSQTKCISSVFSPITVTASGTGLGYQWYSNTSNSNSGGASLTSANGAQTNSYTPQSTVSGTLYYYCIVTGTCGNVTSTISGAFITNGNIGISSQSTATQTKCIGSAFLPITVTASGTGLTYQWYSNTSNSNLGGTSLASANGAQTNSYTPQSTVSGTLYYYCIVTGTCGSSVISLVSGAFFTSPIPTVLSVGTVTQPNCVIATGSVVLNGLPASGPWTITASPVTPGLTGLTGSGVSGTVSGLTAGVAYTFTVSNGTCTSLPSASVPINNVVTTTYNGATWSTTPDITMIGIIDPPSATLVTISSNTELCSCTVKTGKNVIVASGTALKLQDQLTVNGSLTFEDKASLVQINDAAVNTGNITYKRVTNTIVRNTDYTYWSSPVSPLNLAGVGGILYNPSSLAGSMFYSYLVSDTSEGWKSESATTSMVSGEGYIIRGSGPISASALSPLEATFKGVPNNGNVSIAINKKDASCLLGNPYPSGLDANSFLLANKGVIDGTIYFWTHNTKIAAAGVGIYAYSSDDYATYNQTGGVATAALSLINGVAVDVNVPLGKIASGQGFFATSIAVGTVVFNNSMRVGGIIGDNGQFFKINNTKKVAAVERNRIWLDLTNKEGAFKETLIGYVTGATNEYEGAYDGESFDGNTYIDFYSLNSDKNLTIQGRALPFDESDVIPLGYTTTITGDFSINIRERDGFLTTHKVFLEDKLLGTIFDLNEGAYNFTTEEGVFNDRFVLRYTNKTLGLGDIDSIEKGVYVSSKNKQIKINSKIEAINNIQIYDLSGKLIYQKTKIDSNELVISNLMSSYQVLLVKISLLDGSVVTKKLIY
jgi:hypothetical protein